MSVVSGKHSTSGYIIVKHVFGYNVVSAKAGCISN
jgi:hypothetical protein